VTEQTNRFRFSSTLDAWLNNLAKTGRGKKQALSVVVDSLIVMVSIWLAYSLRLGYAFSDFRSTAHLFVFMPLLTVVVFLSLGIYRWVIRSTNRRLFRQLIKACIGSALCFVLLTYLLPPDRVTPRSLFAIYGMLLVLGTAGVRYLWQELFDAGRRGEPVAIYGAGSAGQQLASTLASGKEYRPVLFLDDNRRLKDSTIAGLPVLNAGKSDLIARLREFEVGRVILAMPSLNSTEYQKKLARFEKLGFPVQTVPTISEIMSGKENLGHVRDISIGDILGRSEVPADMSLLGQCVRDKVVLVTGGGGSIGSELCLQIASLSPRKLIALDHSEANLYAITEELQCLTNRMDNVEDNFVPVLCTIKDTARVDAVIREYKVDTVYHAAAYKHVPIIEAQPEQGVEVNVFGTLGVLESSIANRVDNFVLISTDKAVRPTNAMGATKRTAELILQAKARQRPHTRISMVRFGNVLGSSGSVVPKFKKQIESGGPITLTHSDITRYFMTIPEAAQLVLQASAIAKGGDVFVLDMGEPIRIEDLATTMVHLYGKRLRRDTGDVNDIEIRVEGLRPGEKMFEELFIDENHRHTIVPKVFTADENWIPWNKLKTQLVNLNQLKDDKSSLREALLDLAFCNIEETSYAVDTNNALDSAELPSAEPAEKIGFAAVVS